LSVSVTILIIAALFLTFRKHKLNQSHYEKSKSKASERHQAENGKSDYSTATTKAKVVMRNIVLLGILALMFCLTEVTLTYYLPDAKTDFDVWLKYFMAKDACYDTMFFLFSLVVFWNAQGLAKAVACFLVIVTGGSFIDKVIFDLNQYLLSDVVLILMGLFLSIYFYLTRWKTYKTSKHGV
jgi:hypothetical protein